MHELRLFEIPIYRSDGEDLKRIRNRRRKQGKIVADFLSIGKENEIFFPSRKFNDVIGWIVLSIWFGRIRAEYWFVEERIIIGLRNKTFENRGKLFVYKFRSTVKDSDTIYAELKSLLKDTVSQKFPKREIDYECFESVGRHLNWEALLKEYVSGKLLRHEK